MKLANHQQLWDSVHADTAAQAIVDGCDLERELRRGRRHDLPGSDERDHLLRLFAHWRADEL